MCYFLFLLSLQADHDEHFKRDHGRIKCAFCPVTFNGKKELKRHIEKFHEAQSQGGIRIGGTWQLPFKKRKLREEDIAITVPAHSPTTTNLVTAIPAIPAVAVAAAASAAAIAAATANASTLPPIARMQPSVMCTNAMPMPPIIFGDTTPATTSQIYQHPLTSVVLPCDSTTTTSYYFDSSNFTVNDVLPPIRIGNLYFYFCPSPGCQTRCLSKDGLVYHVQCTHRQAE